MKVKELREAIAGLPEDMDVGFDGLSPSDGLVVAVMRFHYSRGYTDALWLAWYGIGWRFEIRDGEVVNRGNGYSPTLQSVLAEDDHVPGAHRWTVIEPTP